MKTLSLAVALATVAAAHAQTIYDVQGVHDVTVLFGCAKPFSPPPKPCLPMGQPRTFAYEPTIKAALSYWKHRICTDAEAEAESAALAWKVRERLGDRGRH